MKLIGACFGLMLPKSKTKAKAKEKFFLLAKASHVFDFVHSLSAANNFFGVCN